MQLNSAAPFCEQTPLQASPPRTSQSGIAAAVCLSSLAMIGFDAAATETPVSAAQVLEEGTQQVEDKGLLARLIDGWEIDAALLWYREDARVQAIEGVLSGVRALSDSESVSAKIVLDSLSGASASGAAAQQRLQTFTRPSGKGEYQVAAGETPLDDTFKDTRLSLSAGWQKTLDSATKVNAGVYGSKEFDYLSLGMSGGIEWGFFKDNTTVSLSGALGFDVFDAVGGRPVPLSTMAIRKDFADEEAFWQAFDATRQRGVGDKRIGEMMLGVTQIISKSTLVQFNYGLGYSSGYLNDPYKLVSVLDSSGNATHYLYESRPDSRLKQSAFVLGKTAFNLGVAEYSYRFTHDDWGLDSHTLEGRYRHYFSGKKGPYLQLHLRAYRQYGVDFFTPYLQGGESVAPHISADYRIGDMDTWTLGLKTGWRLKDGDEIAVRLEYYRQQPRGDAASLEGLKGLELYPELNAAMLQLNYSWN
ncbi:DUF3570 domain-containing protein [Shewanella litorisediminis]|uniref:DUF3570 domain-containing protein n=1 Tax=Shewanella litorisediminis TaxID=1173586 RepID=A0ABX7G822_9GAMM|nr:DUF3570 domain-containing protein [Shewanella litorisediminis]MCL2919134.1 DUF3570 domain-containing protein [Shewanella litorisediminis]QRH03383.1 DUF3570 domain-containing protein [Shewanella litorisediminis]